MVNLYNIKQEIKNTKEDLKDFYECISIKNKLPLTTTIFKEKPANKESPIWMTPKHK